MTSVDFADKDTKASMKSFWLSLGDEERDRLLSLPLRDVTLEMAGPSASLVEQEERCTRFEKHVLDLLQLSQEAEEIHADELRRFLGKDADKVTVELTLPAQKGKGSGKGDPKGKGKAELEKIKETKRNKVKARDQNDEENLPSTGLSPAFQKLASVRGEMAELQAYRDRLAAEIKDGAKVVSEKISGEGCRQGDSGSLNHSAQLISQQVVQPAELGLEAWKGLQEEVGKMQEAGWGLALEGLPNTRDALEGLALQMEKAATSVKSEAPPFLTLVVREEFDAKIPKHYSEESDQAGKVYTKEEKQQIDFEEFVQYNQLHHFQPDCPNGCPAEGANDVPQATENIRQIVTEQHAAREYLDTACTTLADQREILQSAALCNILPASSLKKTLVTLPGYKEGNGVDGSCPVNNSWSKFIRLAVGGLPSTSAASQTRLQLESQLRASERMMSELESRLRMFWKQKRIFDALVRGLRHFEGCVEVGNTSVPSSNKGVAPAIHVYQAILTCGFQAADKVVKCDDQQLKAITERNAIEEQRAKIEKKVKDQPQNKEGAEGRFGTLLAERVVEMTGKLEVLAEQISELEAGRAEACQALRHWQALAAVMRSEIESEDPEAERASWFNSIPLQEHFFSFPFAKSFTVPDKMLECFQYADRTAKLLQSAIDRCNTILDDTVSTMNTMKKRVLMHEDAFIAGFEIALQKLKIRFVNDYLEHHKNAEFEQQARKAKEMAELLMQEEQKAQRARKALAESLITEEIEKAKQKAKAKPTKKKKGGDGKKRKQDEKEKKKQQEAEAQKQAAEQRQKAVQQIKIQHEEEYERQLQQEKAQTQLLNRDRANVSRQWEETLAMSGQADAEPDRHMDMSVANQGDMVADLAQQIVVIVMKIESFTQPASVIDAVCFTPT